MNFFSRIRESFVGISANSRKDVFREYLIDYYKDSDPYLFLYKKCLKCHSLQTELNITSTLSYEFGSSFNDVKRSLSISKFGILNNNLLNTKILYYRIILDGHRTKCQLHFFDNKLFMCTYTFSYLSRDQRKEMIQSIRQKYISEPVNYLRQNIIDDQNVYIQFDDVVELTISYLSLDSDIFNVIKTTKATAAV